MTDSPHTPPASIPEELLPDVPRRGFFASVAAAIIGGFVVLAPLVTGTLFFLDPLLRRKDKSETGSGGDEEGFVKLNITLDQLKESPVPVRVQVLSTKVDKWTRYPNTPIGSVYLQWQDDQVVAFNVTCPHLGCEVKHRKTPEEQISEYYCPCHNSAFALSGEKKNPTPPRDLDSLDVKVVKNSQDVDEIWVKYQQFRTGKHEKVPV